VPAQARTWLGQGDQKLQKCHKPLVLYSTAFPAPTDLPEEKQRLPMSNSTTHQPLPSYNYFDCLLQSNHAATQLKIDAPKHGTTTRIALLTTSPKSETASPAGRTNQIIQSQCRLLHHQTVQKHLRGFQSKTQSHLHQNSTSTQPTKPHCTEIPNDPPVAPDIHINNTSSTPRPSPSPHPQPHNQPEPDTTELAQRGEKTTASQTHAVLHKLVGLLPFWAARSCPSQCIIYCHPYKPHSPRCRISATPAVDHSQCSRPHQTLHLLHQHDICVVDQL
jgi:hypothetical protein